MAHGIENRLDAQIVCNLLPGAGRLAEGQNIGRGGEFTKRGVKPLPLGMGI